jgi:hypothetical protein
MQTSFFSLLMPQVDEAGSASCAAVNRINDDHLHFHDVFGCLQSTFVHQTANPSLDFVP